MSVRRWIVSVGYHVCIVFALSFLGSLLAAPAGVTSLNAIHSAAVAGLGAALAALYASLGALKQGAQAVGRQVRRAARAVAATSGDAAGIGVASGPLRIAIFTQTSKASVTYADLTAWLPALHFQARIFARDWGILCPGISIHVDPPHSLTGVHLAIAILDNSDQADALGYHDETNLGVPYARVFALDCQNAGVSVSSCVSHELLEALADLACSRWAQASDGRLFALEVCDPVESDTYTLNGVELSSYVLPSWFDPNGLRPYDALNKLAKPFELSAGGYGIVMAGGRVSQVFGNRAHYNRHDGWRKSTKKTPLSRTARRLTRT